MITPWLSTNLDQIPQCKAPKRNSDDNDYEVVHIGQYKVPYPTWRSPKGHRDPIMRLLPNVNDFRFPDDTIFHYCKGCRGPGLNNYGVWRTHSTQNCIRLQKEGIKEERGHFNNKRPYVQDARQNKRNKDDTQQREYNPRKGYQQSRQGYHAHAAGIEEQGDNFQNNDEIDRAEHVAPYDDNNSINDDDKTPEINNTDNNNYDDNKEEETYVGAAIMNDEQHSDQENDFQ